MLPRFPSPHLWVLLGALAAADLAYIHFAGLSPGITAPAKAAIGAAGFLTLYAAGMVYRTVRPDEIISNVCHGLLFFFLAGYFGALASYLGVTIARPLYDGQFAAIDRAMGFDWMGLLTFVNDRGWLARTLTAAYHTSGFQLIAVVVFLAVTRRFIRLQEFLGLFLVCAIITVALAALFPAEGPFALHKPDQSLYAGRDAPAGMWHHADFLALRDAAVTTVKAMDFEGIVTFPSFHTMMALLTAWALRDIRWLCAAVSAVSAVVILSTLPEGGHYLIDIIAGAAIFAIAARALHRPLNAPAHGRDRTRDSLNADSPRDTAGYAIETER